MKNMFQKTRTWAGALCRGFQPAGKTRVAAGQWYEENPELMQGEIKAMEATGAEAAYGFREDHGKSGHMYWTIHLDADIFGLQRDWTLLAVYDRDHPQNRWGSSVKFYPIQPDYREMMERVRQSSVTPKMIPHLLRDDRHEVYLNTQHVHLVRAGYYQGEQVTSAAACLRDAIRWISLFESGLQDQKLWNLFHGHVKI